MIRSLNIRSSRRSDGGMYSVVAQGSDFGNAAGAMVMIHGRGASAQSILELTGYFKTKNIIYLAPQAKGNVWYPYSFLSPVEKNEPDLSAALDQISDIVDFAIDQGIPGHKITVLGFSQGACLALEWAARNGKKISGVFGLSGGLIGSAIEKGKYADSLHGTMFFLGCSDIDFHIPKERVSESARILESLGGNVTMKLYAGLGHSVNDDEIDHVNDHIDKIVRLQ